jgi:hypothetical protein
MSRTKRNPNIKHKCLRRPKTRNQILQLQKAVDDLTENGFFPDNRLSSRANNGSAIIPTAWNDINIAALSEIYFPN